MRKVISVILVVVMLINFVTLNGCSKDLKIPMEISADVPGYVLTVGDKTKVKINGTYLNGESDELKDVKLSSSNKDIFEIKDDKIIAKKEGNATLIAKKDDDKIEVPVSVFENEIAEDFQISKEKLIQKTFEEKYKKVALEGIDKPTISSFMAGNDVKIIWSYPDTEKEFILYRSEKDKNKYKQIYEGKAGKNSNEYVDNEVSNKKSYSYKVKVKDSKGKTKESNITSVDVKKVKLFKAEADDDEDGILNEEELKYGLNPFKKDSDGDKKSDKEELKELKNLIKQDKPLKTIEKSTKEVDEGFEKNFKTNNNDVALSVVGDKNIKDSDLSVKELETDDLSTVKGLKGNLYDIELSEEEFKEAEITLSYDENDIGNTKPEDLKVYWLDRDGEKLVALENTKVDEEKKTVTGTTKHFSEYILGDGKILGQQVNEVIGKIDIVFVMDNSIRMQDKDQYGSSKKIIEKYLEIINEINKNEENMRIGLVTYTDKAVEVSPIVSDFNKLTTSLNSIKYIEGNSNIISGLEAAETMLSESTDRRKVMVLISDGKDTSENTNNDIKAVLDDIKDTMTLNTISIGEDIEQEFLQELAKKTNGLYYKVDAKGADEESDITKTAEKMLKQFVVEKIAKATPEDKAALEDKLKLNYPDRFIGMDNLETQMLYSPDNANLLTGNFTEQKTDFTIKSSGQDLEFTRTYNSELNNESSILGNGWTTNLDTKVRVFDENFGRVIASVLNVRETAGIGIENTILTKVTYNTKFEYILDENGERIIEDVEDDKYQWAKIRILNSGIEGYVADKYIREGADSAVELIYESGTRILFNKKTLDDGTLKFVPQADFTDKLEFVNNEYVVTKNGLSKIIYDENGRLKAFADRYGNRVNVEYTDEKVSKISDVNGRFIKFSYNDNGNLKSATDMLGRVATYSYDDYNNLTRVTDLEEVPTTYTYYTSEGNRLKEIYVDTKQERKNEYDIFGRLTAQYKNGIVSYHVYKDAIKDPNDYTKFLEGYEKSMSYYIDEYGRTTEVEYSNLTFKPISAKDIDGHIAKFNYYYDYNRGAEVEDESTRWTSIDNLSDDEDINTYVTEKETDNIPLKKDITDKNDEVYENKYDGNGNLVEHKQPLPSDDADESYSNSRLNKYDKYGNLIERKTKEGYLTKYIYSDDGVYLEKEIDPLGNEKVYEYYKDGEYSTNGLVKSVTDNKMNKDNNIQNKFKVTKYTYDNTYNNKKQTVDGLDENVTIEEYDGAGRLTKKTNPNELVEEYQYDRMDRSTITKKTVADANGGQQVMTERIFYDNFGNKVRELNPKEYIRYEANKNDVTIGTRYEYDESDRLIKIIDGLGNTTQYKYDLAGNKTQEINAKNAVTKYEYDDFGRVKAVTDALGHTLTKNYDKHGNLIEIVDPLNIKTTYEYDKLNRKVKEKIETTTYNNIWEQSYKYDADNRITQVKDAGGKVVKTGYDGLNRKVTEIDGYGVNGTLYKEDNTGEYVSSTDESIESKIEYIYDAGTFKDNNNQDENFEVTTVRLAGDSSVETETYYDVIGQLRKDEDFEGNAIWNSYDIVNNTMTEIDPKENVSLYEYDQAGRLNKLSQDPTIDDSGNITGYINTNTYVYDLNNNMIEHRDPSQILTTVVYDKLDRQCVISMGNHLTTNIPDDFDEETLDDQRNEASLGSQPGGNFTERGNKILYVYDEVSNVVSEYAWDVSEDLNLSEDNSRKTSYKYDLLNRNTKVTDPEGNWFEMGYNWKSDIEYQTSSNNEEIDSGVTYFYDELYRVVGTAQSSKKLEDGDTLDSITQQKEDNYKALYPDYETTYKRSYIEFEYDIKGNLVKQIDPNGNLTTTTYDARDRVTNQVVAGDDTIAAYTTTYGYDKLDNLVVQSDNVPKYMTMYYDKMGRVLKQGIQEEGKADSFIGEKFTYDPNGNPKTHIDGNGNETTFAYDAMDRLVKNTKLVSDVEQNTIYKYFENGNLKSETNWKGYETKYYYNNLNQHTKTTDANLIDIEKIQYFEDKKINILKFDAEGKRYDQEFDKTGRIVYESDPGKNGGDTKKEAIYEYDDSIYGQIITQKMSTEDSINVTKSSMDLMGRLASVETYETDLNGKNPENNVVTKYEYDSNSNIISQENGEKNTTLFEYNAANQVKKRILPGGRSGEEGDYTYVDSLTEKYTYRPDGSINSVLDKNNTITKYSYDIYGRVEEKSGTKAPVNDVEQTSNIISFTYDNNSNIKSMTDGTGTTKWDKYDELNRPTTKNVPDVGEFTYQYDIFPGIGQNDEDTDVHQGWYSEITTDPQGNKTKRIFDKTDRLRGIKAVEGEESFIKAPITKYNYYNDGALRDVEYPNNVGRMDFQFYDNNLVSKVTNGKTGESYEYKYDKVNNLSEKVDKKGTTTYEYNNLSQVINVDSPDVDVSFKYDLAGNRTKQTKVEGSTTEETTYTYTKQDLLEKASTTENGTLIEELNFEFDNNGNQIKVTKTKEDGSNPVVTQENKYDEFNQLIETTTENGTIIENTYNGVGQRVGKKVGNDVTTYAYDGENVVLELDENGEQKSFNLYGNALISRDVTEDGQDETYYYGFNGHGDVTSVTDSSGTVQATYYYDSFGNITEETGTLENPYRYSGYQYDPETELYYLNARMYDPETARFLQPDTYLGEYSDPLSLNLYTYVKNNPMTNFDPTGNMTVSQGKDLLLGAWDRAVDEIKGMIPGNPLEFIDLAKLLISGDMNLLELGKMVGQGLVEDFVYVYQHRDVFEIEWKLWGGNFSDKEVRKMGYHLTGVIKSIFETFFGGGAAKLLSILNKTTKGAKLVKKLSAVNGKLKGKIKKIKNEPAEKAKKAKKAKEKAKELKRKAAEKAKKAKEKALALKKKAKDKVTKKKSDLNDSKKASSSDNKTKEDSDTSSDSNDDVDNDLDDENDTGDVNSNTEDNEGAGSTVKYTDEIYSMHKSGGFINDPWIEQGAKFAKNQNEIVLPLEKTHESARKVLLNEIEKAGGFTNGSNPVIGSLEKSYGFNKQIGRQSLNGKIRWRLDYDPAKGVHYNFENFTNGKGIKAIKKAIPIDISEANYKSILDLWNK